MKFNIPTDFHNSDIDSDEYERTENDKKIIHRKLHLILDYQSHSFSTQSLIKIANDNKLEQLTALVNTLYLSGHRELKLFVDSLMSNDNV